MLQQQAAEILEALWTLEEHGAASLVEVQRIAHTEVTEQLLRQMVADGLIVLEGEDQVRLTPQGRTEAARIIRRHRLAERLLCDVLGVTVEESEDAACEFEHLIAEGVTNAICTLLGHPRQCPHGRTIPEGACCRQAREQVSAIVVPCTRLNIGEQGRIAYISTRAHPRLLRLAALGVTPGAPIKLLQKWPSYVIQCEETEIALEEEIAREIHVWRTTEE
ncbi:MAG TPA: metal-dependent transcriptional regulator [Blastocatellia bacterium]|nr:metal-dependent transcriptional regulator [Blastocatellia bacterium]